MNNMKDLKTEAASEILEEVVGILLEASNDPFDQERLGKAAGMLLHFRDHWFDQARHVYRGPHVIAY